MITLVNSDKQLDNVITMLESLEPTKKMGSQILRIAALTTLAEMKPRITNEGKASDGGNIGSYSTTPIYVSKDQTPKSFGRPLGKEFKGKRRSKFASGKHQGQDHKSRYFEGGYKQFKTAIGRNILGTVNLSLTGQMMNSLALFPTSKGWGLGWQNVEFSDRAQMFERKYGKPIFSLSPRERKAVIKEIKRLVHNAFSR